jgi:hypothetical protein
MDEGVLWIELDYLIVVVNGAVEIARDGVGIAAANEGNEIFRIDLNYLIIVGCTCWRSS